MSRTSSSASVDAHVAGGERTVRWRLLERTSGKPLLLIAGVDSDDNAACHALLRYAFSHRVDNASAVVKLGDAAQEDTVAVIGSDSRWVLNTVCDPDNVPGSALLDHVMCLSKTELADTSSEAVELYKILCFVEIATLFPKVAIPLQLSLNRAAGQVVETWPLVQAFALQDIGPGGFFTQRAAVEDAHAGLSPVYSHVDAACLRALTGPGGAAALLDRQWRGLEALVHSIRNLGRRGTALTCESVAEPLVSFAEFSRMQAGKPGGGGAAAEGGGGLTAQEGKGGQPAQSTAAVPPLLMRGARLLAGTYTTEDVRNPAHGALSCSPLPIGRAVHAIAEADHPSAGLRACRTVFLTGGRAGKGEKAASLHVLTAAYESLRAAVRSSLPSVAQALAGVHLPLHGGVAKGGEGAQAQAAAHALLSAVQAQLADVADIHAGVQLMASDGREVASVSVSEGGARVVGGGSTQAEAQGWRRLVYVKVSVQVGQEGRVAYGDTFVSVHSPSPSFPFSHASHGCILLPSPSFPHTHTPPTHGPHSTPSLSPARVVRVLTDSLPATCVWCCEGEEGRQVQSAVDTLSQAVAQDLGAGTKGGVQGIHASGRGVGARVAPAAASSDPVPLPSSMYSSGSDGGGGAEPIPSLITSQGRPVAPRVRAPTAAPGTQGHVLLLTGGSCRPLEHGALQVFEHGFVVHCPGEGPLVLHARASIAGTTLLLGGDTLLAVAKGYSTGSGSEGVRAAQAAWVDSSSAVVERQTLSFVQSALEPVAGLAGVAGAAGSEGALSSLAQACMETARDVLLVQVRPSAAPDSPSGMLSRLSTCPALWGQEGVFGLVLPGEGEVRTAMLDAHARWRNERSRDGEAASSSSLPLPPSLHAGYLSYACKTGPLAWVQVWEGAHMTEQALLEDARACNGEGPQAVEQSGQGPFLRVLLVQGPAGSGAAAWGGGAVEALGGKLGHMPLLLADASVGGVSDATQACTAALAVHAHASVDSMVLLVLPPHTLPSSALQAVQGYAGGKAQVVGVITVLHSRHVYQDLRGCQPLPHLPCQLRPACCGAVVLLTPTDKDEAAEGVLHRIRKWNTGCSITRQAIGMSTATGAGVRLAVPFSLAQGVMNEALAAWAHPRAAARRVIEGLGGARKGGSLPQRNVHVYAPEHGSLAGGATVSADALVSKRVLAWVPTAEASSTMLTLHAALEEAMLQDCLRALVTLRVDRPDLALLEGKVTTLPGLPVPYTTPTGAVGVVHACAWHATGVVRLIQGEQTVDMAVEATPYSVRLYPAPSPLPATPSLTLTGLGMELPQVAQGVQVAVLACRPAVLPSRIARGRADACSPTERSACMRACLASLPEGCPTLPPDVTYDGSGAYWDMAGAQRGEHPWAAVAVARYVAVHDAACAVLSACLESVRRAAGEEEAVGAGGQAVLWPGAQDGERCSRLTVPALPIGVSSTDVSSFAGTEELTLPLPSATTAPWWVQQGRASAWWRQVVGKYGPV